MSKKETTSSIKIYQKVNDMLEGTFEDTDCVSSVSSSDFQRFVINKLNKLTGRPWYSYTREEILKEGENYINEYIDLAITKSGNNFGMLLRYLYFPVYIYSNERGYEILEQKYNSI